MKKADWIDEKIKGKKEVYKWKKMENRAKIGRGREREKVRGKWIKRITTRSLNSIDWVYISKSPVKDFPFYHRINKQVKKDDQISRTNERGKRIKKEI